MRIHRRNLLKLAAGVAFASPACSVRADPANGKLRLAMVVPVSGVPLFDKMRDGGQEAVQPLDNIDLTYHAPAEASAQAQIKLVDGLIAQKIDGILIDPIDSTALAAVCRKAMQRGIKLISFDRPLAQSSRLIHIAPTEAGATAVKCFQLLAKTLTSQGEVAIIATGDPAHDADIVAVKREWVKPEYAGLKLAAVVEAGASAESIAAPIRNLPKAHPDLKGILALAPNITPAAATAVSDAGLAHRLFVSGPGLPSEMKAAVAAGVTEAFAMWNPVDLGYAATLALATIMPGKAAMALDSTIPVGRLGEIKVDKNGVVILAEPIVFDSDNIEKFAALF